MSTAATISYRLPPAEVRALSQVGSWRGAAHVAAEWAAILGAAWLCERAFSPLLYAVTVVWIGSRQHALGILGHDGVHYLLHRDKRINDWMCQLFVAWPVLLSFQSYRRIHLRHHTHLNTPDDPDWARNRPDRLAERRGFLGLVRILAGLNPEQRELAGFFSPADGDRRTELRLRAVRGVYYTVVLGGLALAGALPELLLYWVVPLFTWFLASMRLKGVGEHFAVENRDPRDASRTTLASWWEQLFIAPKNVHYHIEHHLYPSVPFYRLPALHRRLMALPAFRERAHVTRGYWRMLVECAAVGRAAAGPAR